MLGGILRQDTSEFARTMAHFPQQGHTHSNKAAVPNSATPHEIMEANYIQTTTHMKLSSQDL